MGHSIDSPDISHLTPHKLAEKRRELTGFIDKLQTELPRQSKDGRIFANALLLVFETFEAELLRLIDNAPGSADWFERLAVMNLASTFLMVELFETLPALQTYDVEEQYPQTGEQWAAYLLQSAIVQFTQSREELVKQFPQPDLNGVAVPLMAAMFGLSIEDATEKVIEVRTLLKDED